MVNEEPVDKIRVLDYFNQELSIGDFVIAANGHELATYKIIRITPKMVRVVKLNAKTDKAKKGKLRYSHELFKVSPAQVTYYLLSNGAIDSKQL